MHRKVILVAIVLATSPFAAAAELTDISNYRQYSDLLSSSGQPSSEQLAEAAQQGFLRIVYLAFTDNETAILHEDRTVKTLGMDYIHLPIDFQEPTINDFRAFVAAMGPDKPVRTLVHCQVNFRASTFSFLYRVIYRDVPIPIAKADLDGVWALNETWFRLLRATLAAHGMTHACDECDWGEYEFVATSGS